MYLDFYKDAACTQLYKSVPAPIVAFTSITTPVRTFTYGGVTYKYFDQTNGGNISGVELSDHLPILDYRFPDLPSGSKLYMKNGLVINDARCTSTTMRFESLGWHSGFPAMATNNSSIDANNKPVIRAWSIIVNGEIYVGFNRADNVAQQWDGIIGPQCFIEESFWLKAQKEPYDFGTMPDSDGGQGTGKIPSTGVSYTGLPTDTIPTGGHGLNVYRITHAGLQDFSAYLWGDAGNSIAKKLWQKFQNKTHNPSSCVVGCFKLPSAFMPITGVSRGISIAGINVPVAQAYEISGSIVAQGEVEFDTLHAPFISFLDYIGITCKIHLPMVGEFSVPAEKVIGRGITSYYKCDILNGNIAASVFATGGSQNYFLGEVTGNVAYTIPVVGGSDGTLERIGGLVKTTVGVASVAATGSPTGAVAALHGIGDVLSTQYKTDIVNCDLAGSVSRMTNGRAFVEYIYPETAYAYKNGGIYGETYGYPAVSASGHLSDFSGGYGEFEIVKLENGYQIPNATKAEKEEIERLLREGVIV